MKRLKRIMLLCLCVLLTFGTMTGYDLSPQKLKEGPLTYEITNGKATILNCDNDATGKLVVPATLGGAPVTKIFDHAFATCEKLTSIILPDSITTIGMGAFMYCTSLAHIKLPKKITQIKESLFNECTYLQSIDIPDGVTGIGYRAFSGCETMRSITLPASVKWIGRSATGFTHPYYVWYKGTAAQKKEINIERENSGLNFAKWFYNVDGPQASLAFKDVDQQDWFYDATNYALKNDLFWGTAADTFSPNVVMTRSMFVTVLGRLAGAPYNTEAKTTFTDVDKNFYYYGYVVWANQNGIIAGLTKERFGTDARVTREQICAILVRYCEYAGITLRQNVAPLTFTDAKEGSKYARSAVAACQQAGLIKGEKVNGTYRFRPRGYATRAEVATIIMNFARSL